MRSTYDTTLQQGPFRGLIVSTRPDCVDDSISDLLASYITEDFDVWVELGLQSGLEKTLQRMNRAHGVDAFISAFERLRERDIFVAVHLMFGLPGECWEDMRRTVELVAGKMPDGVKIHNLHIPFGAPLYREFRLGEITVPSAPCHLEYVIQALELLPPETVIMRLVCETPRGQLAVPRSFWDKGLFFESLRNEMKRRGTRQGRLWNHSAQISRNV